MAQQLPPLIPDDSRFPDRRAHAVQILQAVKNSGGDFTKVQTAQSMVMAPLNHRFFLPVLGHLRTLNATYPEAFTSLQGVHADALQQTLASYDLVNEINEINDPALMAEVRQWPRASDKGNLDYSTGRHPLYSLLMLEHPHPATAPYFELLLAAVVSRAIALRSDFAWESYQRYIHPKTRMAALCPQPLNSSLVRIEYLGRSLTGSVASDPLARLAERGIPLETQATLKFLKDQATLNQRARDAVEFAFRIDGFLNGNSGGGGGGGRRDIRDGINLGTLLAGDLAATESELAGAEFITSLSHEIEQRAADLDMSPEELATSDSTILANLGIGASLPASARTALSRHVANQVARAQQLMVTRDSGLRPARLEPVGRLLAYPGLKPEVAMLLRASLASGRPISVLDKLVITTGASVDDADETLEFDAVRQTWRIRVNTPALRKRHTPQGARTSLSHAELPDVVDATALATAYREQKAPDAERVTLRWSADDQTQAMELLKGLKLDADYLGRILPMALYQHSGDLATGALIGRWLPNGSATYLHYLTVDRRRIAQHYWEAARSLKPALALPMAASMPAIEQGVVGMPNCPSDAHVRELVTDLVEELQRHPTATTADRARYINLFSTYTVLYLTQGLGLRSSIDPDPDVQAMPATSGGLGLAIFSDKRVTDAHLRVLYCPPELTAHMAGLAGFSKRIQQEFPGVPGLEGPGLLPFIDESRRARRFHPSDVGRVLGESFDFMPNALRRRARSRMYEYNGSDATSLAHGFSAWMGHWSEANNPHRHEADGLRAALHGVATRIIAPLLQEDGWRALPPRV